MNQGTFSDYHWVYEGRECIVGGYVHSGSYRGIFHTLIGIGKDHIACSRLSKN